MSSLAPTCSLIGVCFISQHMLPNIPACHRISHPLSLVNPAFTVPLVPVPYLPEGEVVPRRSLCALPFSFQPTLSQVKGQVKRR
jgi:hypothetical protein